MSYPVYVPTIGNGLAEAIDDELHRARKKFPEQDGVSSLSVLVEEVGEVARAIIEYQRDGTTWDNVVEEAIQVAAMAIRLIQDGPEAI